MNKVILYVCVGLFCLWGILEGFTTLQTIMSDNDPITHTAEGLPLLFFAIGLNLIAPLGIYGLYRKHCKDLKKEKEALV
jgi:hypothetical protein